MEVLTILISAIAALFVLFIIAVLLIIHFSDRIILRWYVAKKMNDPNVEKIVLTLADKAGQPPPRLYVTYSKMPNAFSVGKGVKKASLVFTSSAMALLNEEELKCVVGHELYHMKKGLQMRTIGAAFAGIIASISTLALWTSLLLGFGQEDDPAPKMIKTFATALAAPHAALIASLSNRSTTEFSADTFGVGLCSDSKSLASALMKVGVTHYEANPGHAHLFFVNPLKEEVFNSLFKTHPSNEDRIKRLIGAKP